MPFLFLGRLAGPSLALSGALLLFDCWCGTAFASGLLVATVGLGDIEAAGVFGLLSCGDHRLGALQVDSGTAPKPLGKHSLDSELL